MSKTKKSLVLSCQAMLLCVSMLIGSTFAWFTDNASTSVNTIQAGTFDVALEMSDDGGVSWESAEGKTLNFDYGEGNEDNVWEPGSSFELPLLRILNKGNLTFEAKISILGIDGDSELLDVIDFTYHSGGLTTPQPLSDLSINPLTIKPNQGADAHISISAKMDEDAGNAYQGKTLSGIAIVVQAKQLKGDYSSDFVYTATSIDELNRALNAYENGVAGNYEIQLMNGNYIIDNKIIIQQYNDKNLTIKAAAENQVELTLNNAGSIFYIDGNNLYADGIVTIEDLTFNVTGTVSGSSIAIEFGSGSTDRYVNNVIINNSTFTGNGQAITSPANSGVGVVTVSNSNIDTDYAINAYITNLTVVDSNITGARGINNQAGAATVVVERTVINTDQYSVRINGTTLNLIDSKLSTTSTTDGAVVLRQTTNSVTVKNTSIDAPNSVDFEATNGMSKSAVTGAAADATYKGFA